MTLAVLLVLAADVSAGKIIDAVPTADPQISYSLYLPSNYTSDRKWPVLYCLDPAARGRVPVERFAKAAEAEGFVVAGSNNSRNGPIEPARGAIEAMVSDAESRFSLDPKRVYAAGFSGGARLALGWGRGGNLAGVVACGAGFGQPEPPGRIPFALFAVAGIDDFNYDELYELSVRLAKADARQRFAVFEGGHEWLPEKMAMEALQFFNGKLPAQPATPSKEQRAEASRLHDTLSKLDASTGKGKAQLVGRLRQDSEERQDSTARRVARRALSGAFIGAVEQARSAMERSDFAAAERCLETALLIRPDAANAREMLERARSRTR